MRFLKRILNKATQEELEGLASILKIKQATPDSIIKAISRNAQNTIIDFAKPITSYKLVVCKVADKMKIEYKKYQSTREIEILIAQKALKTALDKLPSEQKKELEKELYNLIKQSGETGKIITSASPLVALTTARLSGFGVYLLASTSLGLITHSLGFTLPFAVYMAISRTISVILGPIGWTSSILFAVWNLTKPDYKKLIPAIIYISMLRYRYNM